MRFKISILSILVIVPVFVPGYLSSQNNSDGVIGKSQVFDTFFIPKTLRIDYFLTGNDKEEVICLDEILQEPYWGGSHKNLIDPFDYGTYRYSAFDSASGKLIFRRGFSSLFQEWKGTAEAKSTRRAFSMAAVMPFPKRCIRFVIEKRSYESNLFEMLFERFIAPDDYFINRGSIHTYPVNLIRDSGDPGNHLDIAFIAEGYTIKEMRDFVKDVRRISNSILSISPYSENASRINIYAIESPSTESGIDIPGKNIYRNTNMNSSFYTFDMDRYLTTSDVKSVYDIAANVPYDVIIILVNSKQYGGGGFYNLYTESTAGNTYSPIVVVHEFGHSLAGLGDEYVGDVAYIGFYNLNVEPWEPNLTTNKNFDKKWKSLVLPGTPLPTPRADPYRNTVGMFEGGGYETKGIFSPEMNCRMSTNEARGFCAACRQAIQKMIDFYCE